MKNRALLMPAMAALLVCACSGDEASEATGATTRPEPARAVPTEMRTIEVTDAKAAAGEQAFTPCKACHGEQGEGRIGMGPALNSDSFLAAASDAFLVRTITHGRAGTTMAPWGSSLDDAKVESIVAYLRSLNEVPPAELDESPLEGDVEAGERLFGDICSGCHGRTGAGYQETANGTGIGRRAFLDSVTDGYLRYIIEHGKTNTRMRGFDGDDPIAVADLTPQQIEDVIAYLRDHAW